MDANYRDIPILESENLSHLQLQYTPFRVGDFSHDMEESFVDPYVRPRTPMDYHKTPSPPELLEPQGANQQDAAAKSHGEKETEESRALLEASVAGGHWNRTKCVEERREEDVLCANVVYQEILRYSRTVSASLSVWRAIFQLIMSNRFAQSCTYTLANVLG
jgi:hypothetical protein